MFYIFKEIRNTKHNIKILGDAKRLQNCSSKLTEIGLNYFLFYSRKKKKKKKAICYDTAK